jgi:hypothetical protein
MPCDYVEVADKAERAIEGECRALPPQRRLIRADQSPVLPLRVSIVRVCKSSTVFYIGQADLYLECCRALALFIVSTSPPRRAANRSIVPDSQTERHAPVRSSTDIIAASPGEALPDPPIRAVYSRGRSSRTRTSRHGTRPSTASACATLFQLHNLH